MILQNKKAPDFALQDEMGATHRLSDIRGKKVALYFYPKDATPGCTKQACSLRDGFEDLQKAGITVWGISYDSASSHQKFKHKYNLPFTLLCDLQKEVAKLYGVKRIIGGAKRTTFLIDEQGIIVGIIEKVATADHANQILKAFKELS